MKRSILTVLVMSAIIAAEALAGIQTSKHNFSGEVWNTQEQICEVCHTPHHGDSSFDYGPLWNHELPSPSQVYSLYSSPTLDATMEQPGGVSKLCLGCHDGTVAIDSYGGSTGSEYVQGRALIGTNLSDDHPVGFRWEHQSIVTCTTACHFGGGDPYSYPVRFYNHRMECSTCHDPHNNHPDNDKMLRLSVENSELCLLCHNGK